MSDDRIQTRHPEKGKSMPRIDRATYEGYRGAILGSLPRRGEGLLFKELPGEVRARLPKAVLEKGGSVGWYTTTVKLDLEARGEIERVPGSRPQRLRRRR